MKYDIEQAIITGATGAMGRAFVTASAIRGWDLYLTDRPDTGLAEIAAEAETRYGVRATWQHGDLTNSDNRRNLATRLDLDATRPTLLINVAGIERQGLFSELSPEALLEIVRLNVEGTVDFTRQIVESTVGGRRLVVLTVSSLAAFFPMPLKATYSASKRFLLHFSLALREELRSVGGSATALCPAGIPTREAVRRSIEAQGIFGRLTTVDLSRAVSGALAAAIAGRSVYIPGFMNRLLKSIGAILPDPVVARLIAHRWRRANPLRGDDEPIELHLL